MEILIRKTKKVFKAIGLTILVVIFMLVGFHIWFINHSEKTIERLIAWRSNGKLRAKIKKFSIDYFNNNAQIKELSIFNADTVSRGTAYRFTTQELRFNIRSKWDLVFHKKLLIDSLIFSSPNIIITRKSHTDSSLKKLPLAEELGNVYNTINNSLLVLNLERFEINDGKVKVKDAGTNGETRFELNHIFLSIDHLKIDSTNKTKHSFAFSDRVLLKILQQTVKLPDSKSKFSFNQILIDSKLGIIEIANPAINIYPSAKVRNSFAAAASQLNITGLDFNTLYSQPLIKIDSVFMQNPQGDLQFYRKDKNTKNKKQMPLDDALRNLPVAININHVVIKNGTVAVALHQAGKTTVFDTQNDNLSMAGISLNDTSTKVLNIQGFNYTLRNYIGYTPDSIYQYRFDSLQFIDNRIILYRFNITTIKKVKSILIRNYSVPKFEITDMDWPSFIFSNRFKAKKAVLFDAKFNIEKNNEFNVKNERPKSDKKSIYQTLSVMDNLFDLEELKVVNGEFNARQGEDLTLHIGNLNWDINANELTSAKTFQQLIHSVKELYFDTATATNAALVLHVSKSNFNNQNKRLLFKHVSLNTYNQSITANLNDVAVTDFAFDNKELDVNEIHWNDGAIYINGNNMEGEKIKTINKRNYVFSLNNISGNNTALSFENKEVKTKIDLKRITVLTLSKSVNNPFQLSKLFVEGENAIVDLPNAQLTCKALTIKDEEKSLLNNISFVKKTVTDTAIIKVPFISFIPFVNKTIATNNIVIDSITMQQPTVFLTTVEGDKKSEKSSKTIQLPALKINGVQVNDASLHVSFAKGIDKLIIEDKKLSFNVRQIVTQTDNTLFFNQLKLYSNNISINKNDAAIGINSQLDIMANNFSFYPNTKKWELQLEGLSAANFNYSNKKEDGKNLLVDKINIGSTTINKNDLEEGLPWFINKSAISISFEKMHWQTPTTNFRLQHFIFDASKKQAIVDSIAVSPMQTQQDFVDRLIYRKAFIAASSGKLFLDGINYSNDLIHISHIVSNNAILNIYSDNLKKANTKTIKPLPIEALKKIDLPLQIDTVQVKKMVLHYTEVNAVTKKTGSADFKNINGNILNIHTKSIQSIDSLKVNLTGNFMDKIPLFFSMQASYKDSLNGFALQLNVGKGDARLLNPVLEPFALVRVKSGFIDSMQMAVLANDYSAHGTMKLNYNNLNAGLLDSSIISRPRFKTRFYSFLANSFVIRNNNYKRITSFDLERIRTKSAANYLLKMVMEGTIGNVLPTASKIVIKKQLSREMKRQLANEAEENKQ